ncbi:MAG: FG-GAP-like repeat-containing protein [bacterium]
MKKIISAVLFVISTYLINFVPLFSQSGDIHFKNAGGKTNTRVGCNTHGSGFFDYNGDNLPDIFVVHNESFGGWTGKNIPHTLLKNMGNGTFKDVTEEARVQGSTPRTSAQGFAAADYDNDGKTDMVIANGHYPTKRVLLYWQGEGEVFWNATNASKVYHKNRGRNLCFVDYNNDGRLDLFSFGDPESNSYSLLVYKNIGNAEFLLQSEQAGLDHYRDPQDSWGHAFADIDNDGDMDFFSANYETECHLFINNGDGTFTEETTERGLIKQNRFYGAIFLDYNNDGWFDLFVRRDQRRSILYKNNKDGTFTVATPGSGLWETLARPNYGGGLSVADFNNDGYIDILAITGYGSKFRLYRNNGDETFTDVAGSANIRKNTKYNYSAPVADYNQDGYLDIYLARCDGYPPDYYATLFENSGGSNHWLHVKLIGEESNRDAIGARVLAYTDGKLQMRQVLGGDGYKMDSLPVEFGLAGNSVVDSLVIFWPSGIVQREMQVPADTMLTIFEEKRVYYHSFLVSGYIDYYKYNKEVPSVKLQMSGSTATTTHSNQYGFYKFPVSRGYNSLDIIPSKTTDSDIGEYSISAYDAGLTAQAVQDIDVLSEISAKAADVNQNNLIDEMDPLLIAQKAVGLPNSNNSQAGSWRFDPSRVHIDGNIESNLGGYNFTTWVLGDVDGNWSQSSGLMKNVVDTTGSSQVCLDDSTVTISLSLPGNILMLSSDLWLEYDPSILSVHDIQTTSVTDDFQLIYNDQTPGVLRIALFNSVSIWGEDEFLKIVFDVIPEIIEDSTRLHWKYYRINKKVYEKEDIILDLRTFSFSGQVKYYQKNTFVPGVKLTLDARNDDETFTNNNGIYQFIGIKAGDNITVTPFKDKKEHVGEMTISAYDAFLTARHVANVEHLYGLKIQAADVDQDGKVRMSDAEYIARASVGFKDSKAKTWKFSPLSFSYNNIRENIEKDFKAFILGDISGDWYYEESPSSKRAAKSQINNNSSVEVMYNSAYEFNIPISILEGDSLGSADIWGEYDESALELIDIRKAEELTDFHLTYNDSIPGVFRIAFFGSNYVEYEDAFVTLYFRVITKEIEETSLLWKYFRINNNEYNKDNIIIDTGVNDYSYSGKVVYYQDSTGVSNTKLQMLGTAKEESFTNSNGFYTFPEVSKSDSIIVIPSKDRNADVDNFTISAYDAVLVARHAVGLDSLSGYQLKAADVDTNGIIDMLDAVFIAKRSVGITDTASSQAGAWFFSPESQTCNYVSEDIIDRDFTAYILGDVNGDWKRDRKTGKSMLMSSPCTQNTGTDGSDKFYLPLVLENDTCLLSANIGLTYDQSVLELVDIKKNTEFENFYLIVNNSVPGILKIAFFGIEPVVSKQEFIKIYFKYISESEQETKITYENWCINNSEYNKNETILTTGIDDDTEIRLDFKLYSNYPNPFNPETTIHYQIEKYSQVKLVIYNSKGRKVRCLVDKFQNPGKYKVTWNGLDDNGNPIGSGLYFCRLVSNDKFKVIKMVKLK